MKNNELDIGAVTALLHAEYERAKGKEYVRKPLSYALYLVWRVVNERERERGR